MIFLFKFDKIIISIYRRNLTDDKKNALYAGSFDPMTYGHLDIIERASKICDELTVGVIYNLYKEPFFIT